MATKYISYYPNTLEGKPSWIILCAPAAFSAIVTMIALWSILSEECRSMRWNSRKERHQRDA